MSFENLVVPVEGPSETAEPVIPGIDPSMVKRLLPKNENYAENEATKAWISENLAPLLDVIRNDRAELENIWKATDQMEMLEHNESQKYRGRSNAYVPVFAHSLKTLVSTLSTALFPSDEYLDVGARNPDQDEAANGAKDYLQWEFDSVAQLRRHMKPFLSQLAKHGNTVLKALYRRQSSYQGGMVGEAGAREPGFQKVTPVEGLQVSTRSIYNVYVHPTTADNTDEATLIFEDIDLPRAVVEEKVRQKHWLNGDEALSARGQSSHDNNRDDAHTQRGIAAPQAARGPLGELLTVTECWTYMKLPKSAYVEGEDPECLIPVYVVMVNDTTPVVVTRNPYWHQKAPYLFARTNTRPGVFYGYGVGQVVQGLQALTNDFANQMNDCGIYGLNPVVKVNPALLAGPMPPLRPGVTIPVMQMDAIEFDRPPWELMQGGMQLLNLWSSMTSDFSGAPPQLQGAAGGGSAKTATGAQILQKNAIAPLQDIVEDIELDVLIPLMRMAWTNAQQYREEAVIVKVAGIRLKVLPRDLGFDADFRWLASSQAVNAQMRNQQAIALIQSVAPIVPLLQQQGYVVDFAPLLQKMYDGFGFRGFDKFIHKMNATDQMAMQQQQMAQQAAGAEGEEETGLGGGMPAMPPEPMSATAQAPGGGGEMVPGEGEAFGEVRANADTLAGEQGGLPF